jgi:uncharacterized protein YceK
MKFNDHALWAQSVGVAILWTFLLSGCGTINSQFAAGLNAASSDYGQVKKNLQTTDDMKLQAWTDTACAITLGALQRAASTTGNANVTRAALATCPIADMGVVTPMMNGQITVQTNSIQSSQQAPAQSVAPVSANLPTPVAQQSGLVVSHLNSKVKQVSVSPKAQAAVQRPVKQKTTATYQPQGVTNQPATPVPTNPPAFGTLPGGALP